MFLSWEGVARAQKKIWSTGLASSVEEILEGRGVRGHLGLRRDQLDFLQLIREKQN